MSPSLCWPASFGQRLWELARCNWSLGLLTDQPAGGVGLECNQRQLVHTNSNKAQERQGMPLVNVPAWQQSAWWVCSEPSRSQRDMAS